MVAKFKSRTDIDRFARQTLVDHGLFAVPVNPVRLALAHDIRVINAVFRNERIAGMATLRGGHKLILVKEDDNVLRKRFTVAHELGHCLMHIDKNLTDIEDTDDDFFRTTPETTDSTVWNSRRRIEYEANAFAASTLMPSELVIHFWNEVVPQEERSVEVMAAVFQVSHTSMGYRLGNLGLL